MDAQRTMIDALRRLLQAEGRHVRLVETHISWVLVTESLAYKFKKALHLDFLDCSTVQARRRFCCEELRLNRRFAPTRYLGLLWVTGSPERPTLWGSGNRIDYGVVMRAFSEQARWPHRLASRRITRDEVDSLACLIARFHDEAAVAAPGTTCGEPEALRRAGERNLAEVAALASDAAARDAVGRARRWLDAQWARLDSEFRARKQQGFVRECHADLHCGNMLTEAGVVSVFDCLEFDAQLRWIDVMDDLSFACMDLRFHQRPDLASRLLDRYLAQTGDYAGLTVLPLYRTQHALVRAKVALLEASQTAGDGNASAQARQHAQRYLRCALASSCKRKGALLILHGFSGSGKSTLARQLVEIFDAVQVRSDVERKRLTARQRAADPYGPETTQATYARLHALARGIALAGWPVIVDATFLQRAQRAAFEALAQELGLAFIVVDVHASLDQMRDRIVRRASSGTDPSDASLATLAHQLAAHDVLSAHERRYVVDVCADANMSRHTLRKIVSACLSARGVPEALAPDACGRD